MYTHVDYTYEILHVDLERGQMEIKYTSEFDDELLVGIPLPEEEHQLLARIEEYAPTVYWLEEHQRKLRGVPVPLTTGTIHYYEGALIIFPFQESFMLATKESQVPPGVPYIVLDRDDLPSDDPSTWDVDWTNPDGYGPQIPVITQGT